MDHGGQLRGDGRVMSQIPPGGADLCDNLHRPETLAPQTRNLNDTNTLTQTPNLSALQNEEEGHHRKVPNVSLNNNGKDEEEEMGKERYRGKGTVDEEEEDIDEVMKEAEEDEGEESEESSARIHCQSPDTPMTDSSYSETGSLLETPYPFSPGTSPEPTSPVIPLVTPGTLYFISPGDLSQSDTDMDLNISFTASTTLGDMPVDSTTLTLTSDVPGDICVTGTTDKTAIKTNVAAEHFTSSTEPMFSRGPTCTRGSATTHVETQDSSRLTSMTSTTGPLTLTTGPLLTGTDSTSTTGPLTSNWEQITSMPVSTLFTSPLECLQQLAHKGDDTHLPQYLHQIAETFVLHEDYQRALCCIQLERLYHQRVLDNLNALQEHWESKCKTSSNLEIQHLDSLKHICLTHTRPGAGDAVCASLDILKPKLEEGGPKTSCVTDQVDRGMEQRTEDSSCSQSGHPVIPSINLTNRLKSSENSEKGQEDQNIQLQGRESFHGSELTDKEHSNTDRGEAEGDVGYTITVIGNGLHPPTAGIMDQSKPAEQQGGDLGLTQEREAKVEEEERDVEVAEEALEMKDDGEEEEEKKQKDRNSESSQKALPVETLVSGAEVGVQQLHQEAPAESKPSQESQETGGTCLNQEAQFPSEANVKQQEKGEEDEEEEEEEEVYEEEQVDIIREAASLDDMAKLITVEELSPASGLVSILKKRSGSIDNVGVNANSDPQPEKPTAKRRVRFKVPDDSYDQDIGGGDSCLLLFLLCLVTVVISVGGTALYCALGDVHSSICQDFSRNADFYIGQIQRGITQLQHWFSLGS